MVITQPPLHEQVFPMTACDYKQHAKPFLRKVGPYTLTKTLGKGSTGKVKLAIDTETNKKMAVKIVSRKIMKSESDNDENAKTEIRREIRTVREASMMLLLDHPYIVRVEEMVLVDDFYYIFMEHVDGGQLLDYVISHGKLKEKQARHFSRQIASALDYCHRNSIVHRDLKVENILISRAGNIKIIDFGLSNLFSPTSHLSTFCGSLYFAAPELLHGRVYTGPEVDVWSFGVVLYVLVCGQVPFDDPTVYGLHKKVKQGLVEFSCQLTSGVKDLIQRMLITDPQKRATMSQLMSHPWMTKGFDYPIETHLPQRSPLQLPLDLDVVRNMTGFEFGTEDSILEKLESLIRHRQISTVHDLRKRASPKDAFLASENHPLLSIYYLVKERMERHQSNLSPSPSSPLLPPENKDHRNLYNSPTVNMFRRMSKRWSGNHDEFTPPDVSDQSPQPPLRQRTSSLGQRLNRMLKRGNTYNVPPSKPMEEYRPPKRNSVSCKIPIKEAHADDRIRPIYLKGLFSVSTTSTKKASVIRNELIRTIDQHRDIKYMERPDRFQCCLSIGADQPVLDDSHDFTGNSFVQFDIYIIKIPWLLGMRGIQFRRISGDPWIYKNICSRVLTELRL